MSEKQNDQPISLDDLLVLQAVAKTRGFRSAALHLGLSASRVSDVVRRCEERLRIRLFERSTRAVQPTDTLVTLLHDAETPLLDLQSAIAAAIDNDGVPKGVLRIGAPVATGDLFLNALVAQFALEYPEVTVDLRYEDAIVGPVRDGFDLVVRSHALLLADHHAVPIGPDVDLSLVASPAYLARVGVPDSVADIANHDGVCFRLRSNDRLAPWIFANRDSSATVTAQPRVRAAVDSLPAVIELAQAGLGLAMVYTHAVQSALASGLLIDVLPGLPVAQPKFSLAYLSKRHMPAKVRRFVDFVK